MGGTGKMFGSRIVSGVIRSGTTINDNLCLSKAIAAKVKTKTTSSEFCKLMGIQQFSRTPSAILISKFIKLSSHRSPGIRDRIWEENLKTLLHGKNRVGLSEISILLSPQFSHSPLKRKGIDTDAANRDWKPLDATKAKRKSSTS